MSETVWKREFLRKNVKVFILMLPFLIILPFFFSFIRISLILFLLLAINVFCSATIRIFKIVNYALELATFSTIIVSYALGFKIGMIFGIISLFANFLVKNRITIFLFALVPCYMVLAFLASHLTSFPIATAGLICIITYNIISNIIRFLMGGMMHNSLIFILIHIPFNIFLFNTFGNILITLLK